MVPTGRRFAPPDDRLRTRPGISRFRVRAGARPGMTLLYQARAVSGIPSGRLGAFAEIAGPEIIGAQIGQFAFEAFDVQPQRPALAEHQYRAAAGRFARMKF